MRPRTDRNPARLALAVATPLLGAAWAAALVILGLWILCGPANPPSATSLPWAWAGTFLVAAGQFVFMVVVADRLIRPRHMGPALAAQALSALATVSAALIFLAQASTSLR